MTRTLTIAALAALLTGCDDGVSFTVPAQDLEIDPSTGLLLDEDVEYDLLDDMIAPLDEHPLDLPARGVRIEGRVVDLFDGPRHRRPLVVHVVAAPPLLGPELVARTSTDPEGAFALRVPAGLWAPLYLVVSNRMGDGPAIATPLDREVYASCGPGDTIVDADAWTLNARAMDEMLADLYDLDADLDIEGRGAILGSVLTNLGEPVGRARVDCATCGPVYYFDADVRDGLFTHDLLDGSGPWIDKDDPPALNRSTSARAQARFLTSGGRLARLDVRHPSRLDWASVSVRSLPGAIVVTDLEAEKLTLELPGDLRE